MAKRDLNQSGELREGSNFGKGQMVAADYSMNPSITFSNNNAGSIGGAIGGLFEGTFGGGLGGYTNTAEDKVIVAAFTDSYNNLIRSLRSYKAQEMKGGLGTGGSLKVQGGN